MFIYYYFFIYFHCFSVASDLVIEIQHLMSSSIRTGLQLHDDSLNIVVPTSYCSIKNVILASVVHMSTVGKRQ